MRNESAVASAGDDLAQARRRLQRLATALRPIAADLRQPVGPITELEASIDRLGLQVVVAGEVNRGKSTFLNALMGQRVFPPRASVCTAVLTCLRDGSPSRAVVSRRDGSTQELTLGDAPAKELLAHVGRKNPDADKVERVDVWSPNPYARDGVVIIDTPGVNDRVEWRERVTVAALTECDAVLFLLDAQKPVTASEVDFLRANVLTEWGRRIVFLVNKADTLSDAERAAVEERCARVLADIVDQPTIRFISARQAVKARKAQDAGGVSQSGLPAVATLLHRQLVDERLSLYVGDRESRIRSLMSRYRGVIDSLLETRDASVAEEEASYATATANLQRRRRALDERIRSLRPETVAHAKAVQAAARRAWDAEAAKLSSGTAFADCVQALGRSHEAGQEAVRSGFSRAWRETRTAIHAARREDLRRRFGDVIATEAPGLHLRDQAQGRISLPASVTAAQGGSGDGALLGLAAGALLGAVTGGIGWAVLGGLGGMALGAEVGPSQVIDKVKVKAEIRRMASKQRDRLERDVLDSATRAAEGLLDAIRRQGQERIDAELALVRRKAEVLAMTRDEAEQERRRLGALRNRLESIAEAMQ